MEEFSQQTTKGKTKVGNPCCSLPLLEKASFTLTNDILQTITKCITFIHLLKSYKVKEEREKGKKFK
jgi:hypothetical protein